MSSTSSSGSANHQCEKLNFKMKSEKFPTYQSHLSSSRPSSASATTYKYDVFISFRDEDTHYCFTDHLHRDLISNGISVFKDDEELHRGKQISPELFQAIEDSRLSIVVFSKSYATSSWCLDELVHILECMKPGKSIIPIFYDVDPSVVRKQSDTYAEAFAVLESKYPAEKIEKWRYGLSAVADISGCHLNHGSEAGFIQSIVLDVSNKLAQTSEGFKLDGTDFSKNGDQRADNADVNKRFMFLSCNVCEDTVMNFTNFLSQALERVGICFTIRDTEGCDKGEEDMSMETLEEIKHSRLFVIILSPNYAASRMCLDQLVHILECKGKLVDKLVFPIFYNVDSSTVQEQTGIYGKAFARHEGNYKYHLERVKRWRSALAKVGSLPGCELNKGHENEYIGDIVGQITRQLQKNLVSMSDEVSHIKSLDDQQKSLFLDIACFFNGKKVERVVNILDETGFHSRIGMRIFIEKSLLTISNNILYMPEWIQQLGRGIARAEVRRGLRRKLWHHEDIDIVTRQNGGKHNVETMILDQPELECTWNCVAFEGMRNLRLLSISSKVHLPGGLAYLPDDRLRSLKWREYPLKHFPQHFYPTKIVELNMCHGQIKELWNWRPTQIFHDLKTIKLSHSQNLIRTPDFTRIPNLERLVLEGCRNLVEVHPSIGTLEKLRLLNFKGCSSVRSLPDFISMKSLEICVLSGCSSLEKIPNVVGNMNNLSQFYLDEIGDCLQFNRKKWNNLVHLVSNILNVRKLSLRNCGLHGALPSEISCLTSLEVLDVGRNKFVSLPASISQLSKLKFLGLAHCDLLQSVPKLPSNIEYVEARDCSSLLTFSHSFKERTSTDLVLSFINCHKLEQNQYLIKCSMVTLLKAYIWTLLKIQDQQLSQLFGCFDIVIPGTTIPTWFSHQNVGPSVRIHLPPKWSKNNWIGFVFCVLFDIHDHDTIPDLQNDDHMKLENSQQITCQLYTNEGCIITGFGFNISRGTLVESSHLWFHYISNGSIEVPRTQLNRTNYIDASFETASQCLEVKKCGFRVMYKQDVEQASKINLQFLSPPTDDLALGFFSLNT